MSETPSTPRRRVPPSSSSPAAVHLSPQALNPQQVGDFMRDEELPVEESEHATCDFCDMSLWDHDPGTTYTYTYTHTHTHKHTYIYI